MNKEMRLKNVKVTGFTNQHPGRKQFNSGGSNEDYNGLPTEIWAKLGKPKGMLR